VPVRRAVTALVGMGKSTGWALGAALLTAAIAACGPAEDSGWIDSDGGATGPASTGGSSSGGSVGASADAGAGEATGSSGGNAGSGSGGASGSSGGSGSGGSSGSGGGSGGSGGAADAGATEGGAGGSGDGGLPCTLNTAQQGSSMRPGDTCIACHAKTGEAPVFSIAGTVYDHLAEPTLCDGVSVGGAQVVITDANKNVLTISVNSVGNFSSQAAVATPYTAAVTYNGNTTAMSTPQTSGDCNGCHTAKGANGAPGRVLLP
jgi:hypothetical protein